MNLDTDACCTEFRRAAEVSRRRFLQGAALAGGAAVATSVFGGAVRQAAFADTAGGNVVVVISLRGGIDGLGWVVPHADPGYYAARPRIAVPAGSLLQKDEMFGLHPKLQKLERLFRDGQVAAVQAVGMSVPNRSHFSAMEEIEDADPTSSVRRGWVNRMVGLDGDASPVEAVHLSSAIQPTLSAGPAPTLATNRLRDIALPGADPQRDDPVWRARRTRQLHTSWDGAPGVLGSAGRSALRTVAALAPTARTAYQPENGVRYPDAYPAQDLSRALQDTAQLIRADLGTEVVTIDYGSWDMHSDYGTLESGRMQAMTAGFAAALEAFMTDLGELRSRVTVVTISEFGRRVAENGNRGLDHGWGNAMLVIGGGVKGGYYANWPTLSAGELADGDLRVTTDYRSVLGEVVQRRLNRGATVVFPGLDYRPLGLMA